MPTLLSVLCAESLSSFLIVNCHSIGFCVLCASASVFSVEFFAFSVTVDCGFLWVSVKGARACFPL
jgi:hypothetical protein